MGILYVEVISLKDGNYSSDNPFELIIRTWSLHLKQPQKIYKNVQFHKT